MSTNRQKSFIASMSFYGQSVAMVPDPRNKKRMIWGQNGKYAPDQLYFRCKGDYYNIYIRSKGQHYGKTIDQEGNDFVANPPAGGDTTSFNITDKNSIILTLDDLPGEREEIYLRTRSGGKLTTDWAFADEPTMIRLGAQRMPPFILHILERNVPYLSHPDEV